ncbi:hypothetical protein [Streptomyces sp. CB03238]|uniref:hypothetical protein n=1 Tax=Streptomyces sp. CB03238 TaxID=1907777 RepID=UPI0015C4391F|nr:hypothetical protein [Streptomyces sp. CB03238]
MTEPDTFDRPGTTPAPRRRRPAFAAPRDEIDVPPLDQIAPDLEPPWHKEDTDTPHRTAAYRHRDGHRIGLRIQPRSLAIQTWITAGPDLPPIPDGTAIEQAEAQAANDARLQPGRTWHTVLTTRTSKALAADLGALVRERLLPALTNKPRGIPAPPPPEGIGQPTLTPQKEGTQK